VVVPAISDRFPHKTPRAGSVEVDPPPIGPPNFPISQKKEKKNKKQQNKLVPQAMKTPRGKVVRCFRAEVPSALVPGEIEDKPFPGDIGQGSHHRDTVFGRSSASDI